MERDEQIAEWIKLSAKVAQLGTPLGGAQPAEKGIRKAARELGITKNDASRAVKGAELTEEAKEAAREVGLDDNRSALRSDFLRRGRNRSDRLRNTVYPRQRKGFLKRLGRGSPTE